MLPLAHSDTAIEADDEISTSYPSNSQRTASSKHQSRTVSRSSSPRKHLSRTRSSTPHNLSRTSTPKHYSIDDDPSLSQMAMDKLVLIHEQQSHPLVPSRGYSSSDHSLQSEKHLKTRHFFKDNEIKSSDDQKDLHIKSPLQFHLGPEMNAMSITINDRTIISTYEAGDEYTPIASVAPPNFPQRRPHIHNNKRRVKSEKVVHEPNRSRRHHAPPQHQHNRVYKNESIQHKNESIQENSYKMHTRAVLPLLPSDSEVYGGPVPYFVKRGPKKGGKTLNPISPSQSKDPMIANTMFDDWFMGHSESNLVIETHKKIMKPPQHNYDKKNLQKNTNLRTIDTNSGIHKNRIHSSSRKHSNSSSSKENRRNNRRSNKSGSSRSSSNSKPYIKLSKHSNNSGDRSKAKHRNSNKSYNGHRMERNRSRTDFRQKSYATEQHHEAGYHRKYARNHVNVQKVKVNLPRNIPQHRLQRSVTSPVIMQPQNYHIDDQSDATSVSCNNSTVLY